MEVRLTHTLGIESVMTAVSYHHTQHQKYLFPRFGSVTLHNCVERAGTMRHLGSEAEKHFHNPSPLM